MDDFNLSEGSAIACVRKRIARIQRGKVFSIDTLNINNYSKSAIQLALRKLIEEKVIFRFTKGIYFKPEKSTILKNAIIPPSILDVINFICKKNKEIIQVHGGIAANRLRLSTQVPLTYVFYTSGYSRTLYLRGSLVKFIHTDDKRILQHVGTNVGLAISAMYFFGKNIVDEDMVKKIKDYLTVKEYEQLKKSELPVWMKKIL